MICTHPCFKLSLSQDEKERMLSLAQLLEKKVEEKPGHPLFLAKHAEKGELSKTEKAAFNQQAIDAEDVDDAGQTTSITRHGET